MSAMDAYELQYKNGHWQWDGERKRIVFVSHELVTKIDEELPTVQKRQKHIVPSSIRFKEEVEPMDKVRFRRFFQRRIGPNEPEIITLQDVKDVALFLAFPKDLTVEFVTYFHLPEVDRFLKALIIYFHYFLQVTDTMQARKEEARRKLRQPIVTILENIVRDNLSDLRAMVGREYSVIIMGIGKSKKFHHLSTSTNSLSEKDRRLMEALFCMSVRVVWVALQRRHLQLIELELNRLVRTDMFNAFAHKSRNVKLINRSPHEIKVLLGLSNIKESKLKQRSGLIKELLITEHDYRMIGSGFKNFEPKSERTVYFERLFAAPYETLLEHGVTIGLIGIPREEYDSIMKPRERTSQNFDKAIIEPINFTFPPDVPVPYNEIPNAFPKEPCQYEESEFTKKSRIDQCRM